MKSTTSRQKEFLSEILEGKPIPEDKLIYFRERLRDRLHSAILRALLHRTGEGFRLADLADRIDANQVQISNWVGSSGYLTLDSISDLMVGLGMDFDDFAVIPIEKKFE